MAKGRKTGGRAPGVPNKVTREAREAVALLVEKNAPKLQRWLNQIANGRKGKSGAFIISPNPAKAFELLQSLLEFHIPKLARTEHTGADGEPIETRALDNFELAKAILFDVEIVGRDASKSPSPNDEKDHGPHP